MFFQALAAFFLNARGACCGAVLQSWVCQHDRWSLVVGTGMPGSRQQKQALEMLGWQPRAPLGDGLSFFFFWFPNGFYLLSSTILSALPVLLNLHNGSTR